MILRLLVIAQSLITPSDREYNPDWIDGIVPAGVVSLFTAMKYEPAAGPYAGQTFYYRLYEPSPTEPGKLYPILVWTSGYGEMGDNNFAQLRHLNHIFQDPDSKERYPFYCLVMQVPKNVGEWVNGKQDGVDMADVLMDLLDQTMNQFPVDPERVYLSGVSIGGKVCFELAMRYPDRFAALAPLASGGCDLDRKRLARIIHIPIWMFHSTNDPLSPIGPAQQTANLLTELGGIVFLTEVASDYHDCWTSAFLDHELMGWLLAQRRGDVCSELPGRIVLNPWHAVIPIGALGVFVLAVVQEIRRRRSLTSSTIA
jgi:predicted peptidase